MGPLRRERAVHYSVFSSQGFHHTKPAAVIFILGFVIYRSGRKLKNTAQSHRKWVSNHPLTQNDFNLQSNPIICRDYRRSLSHAHPPQQSSPSLSWSLNPQPFLHWASYCTHQFTASSRASCDPAVLPKRSPVGGQRAMGTPVSLFDLIIHVTCCPCISHESLPGHHRHTVP